MIVSKTEPFDKKRSKVFIDGEFCFVLYNSELRKFHIQENEEISSADYAEITEALIPKRCKLRAMNLLQKKDYTTKQLADKLREGLYSEDVIADAIDYVTSYRYLDDERYARDYIVYQMERRSKNRIIQDLTSKGIEKESINTLISELYPDDENDAELKQIQQLLSKKHYDPMCADFKEKQKLTAFLMRKGYNLSDIKKAMSLENID